MAFDKSKPYGTAVGGPTNGMHVQDDKTYNHAGNQVDANGKELPKAAKPAAVAPKAEEKKAEVNPQLAAQLQA